VFAGGIGGHPTGDLGQPNTGVQTNFYYKYKNQTYEYKQLQALRVSSQCDLQQHQKSTTGSVSSSSISAAAVTYSCLLAASYAPNHRAFILTVFCHRHDGIVT
jgi:hypothetical protein